MQKRIKLTLFLFLFLFILFITNASAMNLSINLGSSSYQGYSNPNMDYNTPSNVLNASLITKTKTYDCDLNSETTTTFFNYGTSYVSNFSCYSNYIKNYHDDSSFIFSAVLLDLGQDYYFANRSLWYVDDYPNAGDFHENFWCLVNNLGIIQWCDGSNNFNGFWHPFIRTSTCTSDWCEFIMNVTGVTARYFIFGVYREAENILNYTSVRFADVSNVNNNSFPSIDILNQKSVYCNNESTNQYVFDLTATDAEGDTIYYYDYWNDDFEGEVLIDDFSGSDYSMSANGWAFNGTGCNYSTSEGYLELYSQCQNISMIKWLDSKELSGEDLKVSFQAWAFRNTTNTYEIWNWQNEKIGGLKLATYFDSSLNAIYTNFSYWNGTTYIYFNQSYYVGLFGFDFYMNDTHLRICGSGLDENLASWEDCKYEIIEESHGTTNNIPAKFYMAPSYNNMWEQYEPSYIVLDELSYQWTEINWLTYNEGDSVSHVFSKEGQEILNILVTDNIHTPDYTKYVFPITVFGDCANELNTTTNLNLTGWDEIGDDFLSSVGDGKNKFNTIFYIFLFLAIIYMLYNGFNFEIAVIVVGWTGIAITFVLSGGMIAFISSASLIALGLGIILTRVFV